MPDLILQNSKDLSTEDFIHCYKMVRKLRSLYISSGMGWNAKHKKNEMMDPNMQFLILKNDKINAFASFVLEDHINEDGTGEEVTYLYELHVDPSLQRSGCGKLLIEKIKQLSRDRKKRLPIILTVINGNINARKFYKRMGFKREEEEEEEELKDSEDDKQISRTKSNNPSKRIIGWHQLRLDWE